MFKHQFCYKLHKSCFIHYVTPAWAAHSFNFYGPHSLALTEPLCLSIYKNKHARCIFLHKAEQNEATTGIPFIVQLNIPLGFQICFVPLMEYSCSMRKAWSSGQQVKQTNNDCNLFSTAFRGLCHMVDFRESYISYSSKAMLTCNF